MNLAKSFNFCYCINSWDFLMEIFCRMDLANNADRVNQELQDLAKGQSVMVSMADHVMDTKKRVEYGVHQILLEVGDLMKAQGVNINSTLSQRFDGISNDIMDNQNGALANLTSKMELEMNKVINIIGSLFFDNLIKRYKHDRLVIIVINPCSLL